MTGKLQPVRGTKDILFDDQKIFNHIVDTTRRVGGYYGFKEISIPIFEFTEVFKRTLGETSDVVSKEMYVFEDKGNESITLRPEFTAGIARSFISNGLTQKLPIKLFSYGPLFRYERPQKGRQRQFHQINMEILGISEPFADIETISLANNILKELGIADKTKLEINSLGDKESRDIYRAKLIEYYKSYEKDLSQDSLTRLEVNPLRILDSKDEKDKAINQDAPKITNHYTDTAKKFFDSVQEGLGKINIEFTVNNKLVRGLDYYCHTAFEFTTDMLGAQNAVLAGGRYDGLIAQMGGPQTPAIGFAGGIERLMALCDFKEDENRPVVIIPIGGDAYLNAIEICNKLRSCAIYTEVLLTGNVGKRMKKANNINAKFAIIFGDEEVKNNVVNLKDFDSGQEKQISNDEITNNLNM